jgi:para-aminobenzoate synthetase component 1
VQPFVEELSRAPDPVECCERLAGLPYRLFLDSAARGSRLGRYSFLTADPIAVVRSKGTLIECIEYPDGASRRVAGDLSRRSGRAAKADALIAIRDLLAPFRTEAIPELPPFQGGAAGYLAYDWGRVLERLPAPRYDDLALPDVVLGFYDWVLAWDHESSRAWIISTGLPETTDEARKRRAADRAAALRERIGSNVRRSEGLQLPRPTVDVSVTAPSYPIEHDGWDPRLNLRSSFTHAGYVEAVQRVREYIYAGDIFQANLSQRFEAPLGETSWELYRRMRVRNAAPFAAYFECPEAAIVSASPERFLRVDIDGHVETRPIKGTRPRGVGPEHDGALGQALTESGKDRAENLMIVDLMRNDLSRVCAPGTVRVPELFALEHYATVHHLVSTVVGRLGAGSDAFDLIRATFPGGSITGAPKIRAMEIIAELEPSQRSVYCGAIGYWSLTGAVDTNIAIRTAIAADDRVYFSAGGGIVADSNPEQEYRETLDKARGMIDSLARNAVKAFR